MTFVLFSFGLAPRQTFPGLQTLPEQESNNLINSILQYYFQIP